MTVPRPLAADGVVINDPSTRTLIVKPAKAGYASLCGVRLIRSWRRLWGRAVTTPSLRCGRLGPQGRGIARGVPAEDGSLRFHFERGDPNYRKLVSTPFLSAIVVVDRATKSILGVKFRGRRG